MTESPHVYTTTESQNLQKQNSFSTSKTNNAASYADVVKTTNLDQFLEKIEQIINAQTAQINNLLAIISSLLNKVCN